MARKVRKIIRPSYLDEFQCIADRCDDTCCVGWDVEIDQRTYEKYEKTQHQGLTPLFRSYIHRQEDYYDKEVDYAYVALVKQKRCPFLNDQGLCKIQAALGESYLSNVCATYPRSANIVDGVTEYSLTLSCREAAWRILSDERGIVFDQGEESVTVRRIINCKVDTTKHHGSLMVKYLKELRELTITILQNRSFPLPLRLWLLAPTFRKLDVLTDSEIPEKKKFTAVEHYLSCLRQDVQNFYDESKFSESMGNSYWLIRQLTDDTNTKAKVDMKKYSNFIKQSARGIEKVVEIISKERMERKDKKNPSENKEIKSPESMEKTGTDRMTKSAEAFSYAYEKYYKTFEKKYGHIMENYLVNYVFQELFPAGESTKPLESYGALVLRYALIRYYLTGLAAESENLNTSLAIAFIQAFSKAVEHHHTYLEYMTDLMKTRGADRPEMLSVLLGMEGNP